MPLLVDLFGYLSVVLHGLVIVAQSAAVGGAIFLALLARPLAPALEAGIPIRDGTARIAAAAALALAAAEGIALAMQAAVLVGTVDLSVTEALGANYALWGGVKIAAALALAAGLRARAPSWALLAAGVAILVAATMGTHAAARLEDRAPLLAATGLHLLGAAIWIGGIPCFVLALARVQDGAGWRRVGARFSRMSMAGVACILASAAVLAVLYIGDWRALYGTAYGVMVGAKAAIFAALLLLGFGNFLTVERLRRDPGASVLRMKRFAEVEIGLGVTLFLAAASLTSVPPAVDLTQDRVSWSEIAARNAPAWPRLASPDHQSLALIALQDRLDREAAETGRAAPPAFVPGEGVLPPRNAQDIAWSEYNHHWAGLFVLAIGLLALLNRGGARWARHWPLLFLGLAAFLFLRSDPEVWPLGTEGLLESLRDVEVLQHRVFVLLVVGFALFEWRVRAGSLARSRAALVFPLVCAAGGALLLTHSHAIANVKEALLIELTHTPLALAAVAAGWTRWLELRLGGRAARAAGWAWPACLVLIGLILLNYREA